MTDQTELRGVRGAVYVPARAFNAYQLWDGYAPDEIERDVAYATKLGLNALRVFLSYEYWQERPEELAGSLDHLLTCASERGIGIVPILFESAGVEPTPENLTNRDTTTACAVHSPAHAVIRNEAGSDASAGLLEGLKRTLGGGSRWAEPRRFVEWVMDRYADDSRLLAVELMNEPGGWDVRVEFARAMLRTAADNRGSVPLTMGCKELELNRNYTDPELDVYQFHYNIPPTADDMAAKLAEAAAFASEANRPVWLTEWQRTRETPPDVLLPNYASLAETVRSSDVDGDFFWSLMLKPAYLPKPRRRGRINGVFHEDGQVWSGEDARALAADPATTFEERGRLPSWIPPEVTPNG